MKRHFSIFFTFLFVLFLGTSCDMDNPEIKNISDFKINKINASEFNFNTTLTFHNPNTQNIAIRKSVLDLYIDDLYIGKAHLLEKVKLNKKETTSQSIPVKVDLERGVLLNLLGSTSKSNIKLRISGPLKVSVGGFPISKKIDKSKALNINDLNLNINLKTVLGG